MERDTPYKTIYEVLDIKKDDKDTLLAVIIQNE